MTAEIICVGTELLLGNIVNTNAAFLAERLAALGISCHYQTVVGDNRERILEVLKIASGRADLMILTGGLGPTEDDLTAETVAEFCKKRMSFDDKTKKRIAAWFEKRGIKPSDNNWKQAMIPEGSIIFQNNNGTAPGMAVLSGGKKYILLPGPPDELSQMFLESVEPYLAKDTTGIILSQTVKTCGVSESSIEENLTDLIKSQGNPTIATYAKTGEVHVRVTAHADSEKDAAKMIKPIVKELKARFGNDIYTTQEEITLEKAFAELLESAELTISCAESCTGGILSGRLTNVPGISELFKTGLVTYSNKSKRRLLGVKKGTLQKYGAVSSQTVQEMVKGLVAVTKTDVGIAISGIAGPDGGSKEKPVGLVYIGCCVKGKVTVKEYHFSGNREKIRNMAVTTALMFARSCVLEYLSKMTFGK